MIVTFMSRKMVFKNFLPPLKSDNNFHYEYGANCRYNVYRKTAPHLSLHSQLPRGNVFPIMIVENSSHNWIKFARQVFSTVSYLRRILQLAGSLCNRHYTGVELYSINEISLLRLVMDTDGRMMQKFLKLHHACNRYIMFQYYLEELHESVSNS